MVGQASVSPAPITFGNTSSEFSALPENAHSPVYTPRSQCDRRKAKRGEGRSKYTHAVSHRRHTVRVCVAFSVHDRSRTSRVAGCLEALQHSHRVDIEDADLRLQNHHEPAQRTHGIPSASYVTYRHVCGGPGCAEWSVEPPSTDAATLLLHLPLLVELDAQDHRLERKRAQRRVGGRVPHLQRPWRECRLLGDAHVSVGWDVSGGLSTTWRVTAWRHCTHVLATAHDCQQAARVQHLHHADAAAIHLIALPERVALVQAEPVLRADTQMSGARAVTPARTDTGDAAHER